MADYSLRDLRRFASDILPFLCVLVVSILRGEQNDAFEYFRYALELKDELQAIAEDQKYYKQKSCCMYLVNFHDYVEAMLHVNLKVDSSKESSSGNSDLIAVKRMLTRLELASDSELPELYQELFSSYAAGEGEESILDMLIRCLHVYYTHLLVLNIELQRAKNSIVEKVGNTSKRNVLKSTRICIAPELPSYLTRALQSVENYYPIVEADTSNVNIMGVFAEETNIGFDNLSRLNAYKTILPIIAAYIYTLQSVFKQSAYVEICKSILDSELWRKEWVESA